MRGPVLLLVLFVLGALVAIGAGTSIGSPPLVIAGLVLAGIGAWLARRHRGER